MRPNIKIISGSLLCAGIFFLGSCSKQGATEKDVAKAASSAAPAEKSAPTPATTPPAAVDSGSASPTNTPAPATDASGQRYVQVSTINGIDANNEFQRNTDLVQAQRQLVINLNDQIGLATSNESRAALQEQYDQALAKLNENNQQMLETYGYSLNRNYVRVIDKSQIFMAVSEEEAARVEADSQKQEEE